MITTKKKPLPQIEEPQDPQKAAKARVAALAKELAGTNNEALDVLRALYKVGGEDALRRVKEKNYTPEDITALGKQAVNTEDLYAYLKKESPQLFDGVEKVQIDAAAQKLMQECGAVKIAWTWFKTSIKVDNNSKTAMAAAAGTTNTGFSASKRLMDSKHPIVKEANELKHRVTSYIRGISLPVTKLGDTAAKGKKEGGTFLVRQNDLASFEEKMTAFQSELKSMESKINSSLDSIKLADQLRLESLYRATDYPAAVQLRMNYYPVNLEPPAYLEKFAEDV